MNKSFKDDRDSSTEIRKWKIMAETAKERLDKLVVEVDGAVKRANDSEAILKRVAVENINLKAISGS